MPNTEVQIQLKIDFCFQEQSTVHRRCYRYCHKLILMQIFKGLFNTVSAEVECLKVGFISPNSWCLKIKQ